MTWQKKKKKNSKEVKILGITLDRNMNFHTRIKNICRKADQKLSPMLRKIKKRKFYYTSQ